MKRASQRLVRRSSRSIAAALLEPLEHRRLLSATATLVKDILPGTGNGIIDLSTAATVNLFGGGIYFAAEDSGDGFIPWVSSGTSAFEVGTGLDKGTNVHSFLDEIQNNSEITYWIGKEQNDEVFQSVANLVTQRTSFNGSVIPNRLAFVNSTLLFSQSNGSGGLWAMPAGSGAPTNIGTMSVLGFMGEFNGYEYFGASTDQNHWGLWKTNGSAPTEVKDFGTGSVEDEQVAVFNNQLYFEAENNQGTGFQLWRSDGSTVTQISTQNAPDGLNPHNLTISGGTLYFIADDTLGTQDEQIFKVVGNGVQQVTTLPPGFIAYPADFNGQLFFTYHDAFGVNPALLYKLVGGTATMVGTSSGGPDGGTNVQNLTVVNSTLFFSADDTNGLNRLFETDGNTISLVGGDPGFDPHTLRAAGNLLFYAADDPVHGTELHVVKGIDFEFSASLSASKTEGNEGDTITFTANTNAPTGSLFHWDLDGDGTYEATTRIGVRSMTYADNKPNDAPFTARVKITTPSGDTKAPTIGITIHNVAPTLKVIMVGAFVPGEAMPYEVIVGDPGVNDTPKVLLSWDTEVQTVPKNGVLHGTHTFPASSFPFSTVSVLITVADKDGGAAHARRSVKLIPGLVVDTTLKALGLPPGFLGSGTPGNDRAKIQKTPEAPAGKIGIDFFLGGVVVSQAFLDPTDTITVNLGDGNDRLEVDPLIDNRIIAEGGAGNDTLGGGGGNDFLRGGLGDDKYLRSAGKDRLLA